MKNLGSMSLYLHCEECEYGWRNIELSSNAGAAFLTLDEKFDAEIATKSDLLSYGWEKYELKYFDE
jgi:hypothetical protein